ncbi:hypothetical protein ACF5W4_11010 [Bacillota bacterium Lsc_1132]
MKSIKVPIVKGIPGVTGKKVTIAKTSRDGYLKFTVSLFENPKTIKIDNVFWEEQRSRNLGKAAAGAIAGGLLTGGIGLLAGAAIGGRSRDNSRAVLVTNTGEELLVQMTAKEYEEVSSWL